MIQIALLPEEPGWKLQKVKTSRYVFYSFLVKVLKYELYVSFFSFSHPNTLLFNGWKHLQIDTLRNKEWSYSQKDLKTKEIKGDSAARRVANH